MAANEAFLSIIPIFLRGQLLHHYFTLIKRSTTRSRGLRKVDAQESFLSWHFLFNFWKGIYMKLTFHVTKFSGWKPGYNFMERNCVTQLAKQLG